ncbi:T9SS type A sorting domain-containing protein [Aequorivita sp. CIP111184]|uniref:T9SS type A sorting domain-containing protein n=1 Tax=Aequorivita sp. CIP111184 TaxID=2211356 RepID=UPI000DBBCA90|nr:T9SS type A sorting domain-containing protein [Aequorivita sp. CIP111184]SRX55037.1 Xyloglucanase [Aequorivita sp. CIP111184]
MKRYTLPFFLMLLLLVLSTFFISSYKNNSEIVQAGGQEKIDEEKPGKLEYPAEWMYNQRAYPNNYINKEAYKRAIIQTKQILANRSPEVVGEWAFVGPLNTGGRITDVAIAPDNDDHLYVATATGGIFRSYDRGANWIPIFDDEAKMSIGDIAIASSNPQRIYAGTGEANGSATDGAYFGDGIYRSDNAGDTWTNIGLPESSHIGRIVVDPKNPDRVFVAATGQLYGKNSDRGIYRTLNGGGSWEQVLFVTDSTSAIDVAMNVANTNIIYAAMWERTRKPWERDYGGLSSAIHRSLDGGFTWTQLGVANGLPAPNVDTGRIGIAVSESDPSTVYARYTTNKVTNEFNGLYKSTDNGNNWTLVTPAATLSGIDANFGWYFGNLRVNPTNSSEVYIVGFEIAKSIDSGASWQTLQGMHVDHHALEFSRTNSNFMFAGNDGGAYISNNGGSNWTKFLNLPLTQFYNIEVDKTQPERLYGGTQDNNTIRTITGGASDWNSIWGGDGFHVNVDPVDNNYIYVESQYGNLGRSINGGNSFDYATNGISGSDRNNWNTPVIISPFDHEILYYGTNRLYTSNKASNWSVISPDLTDGVHPSGSLAFGTLTAIASSYNNLDVIYTGSDDGNVNVTFDGGATWTNVSTGLPDQYITSIAMSPNDDMIAYVTVSGFKNLEYTPHVFKTMDGGENWTDISSNLPSIPVNDIITYSEENILLVATDLNVWFSINEGASWDILGNGLPLTVIMDLKLHEPTQTLYAGTFGRGMFSIDNVVNICLGIDDNELSASSIILYPNPATLEFTISQTLSLEGSIQLFNISGKMIKELFHGNFGTNKNIKIKTDGIASGIYLIRVSSGEKSVTTKLVISN